MDPLRPLADVIRALWQARTVRARDSQNTQSAASPAPPTNRRAHPARSENTLRASLKARISQIDTQNPRKVREAFVETVLLWELGERLGQDAGFGEMVTCIADQLASNPAVSQRLEQLLARMA
jgi:hypothetical protein